MTDTERVQQLFEHSGGRIITPMEIITLVKTVEYTGRISNAREDWNCTCGQDPDSCTAKKHIINIGKNKYVFKGEAAPRPAQRPQYDEIPDITEIESKYNALKAKYRQIKSVHDVRPTRATELELRIIEVQGKALRKSLDSAQQIVTIKEALI